MQVTSREYKAALDQIKSQITDKQRRILEAHYLAPDRTATAAELSQAIGGTKQGPANSIYSGLAGLVREALGQQNLNDKYKVEILVALTGKDHPVPDSWVMHPELATAIRQLGWFSEDPYASDETDPVQGVTAQEGQWCRRMSNHRHREMSLRRAKLAMARDAHPEARLLCEVPRCGFDFAEVYGKIGEGFAEVHHLRPLSDLDKPIMNSVSDLAVVCANCHRMIHRGMGCLPLDEIIPAG